MVLLIFLVWGHSSYPDQSFVKPGPIRSLHDSYFLANYSPLQSELPQPCPSKQLAYLSATIKYSEVVREVHGLSERSSLYHTASVSPWKINANRWWYDISNLTPSLVCSIVATLHGSVYDGLPPQ